MEVYSLDYYYLLIRITYDFFTQLEKDIPIGYYGNPFIKSLFTLCKQYIPPPLSPVSSEIELIERI